MVIYADILPAGWILRSVVNFSYLYHLIKGMRPKICGNWVLLIYFKIPTSLLEDYSLDIWKKICGYDQVHYKTPKCVKN